MSESFRTSGVLIVYEFYYILNLKIYMEVCAVSWYRWAENILQVTKKDEVIEIMFPGITTPQSEFNAPVFSKDERYIAVRDGRKIYIYDSKHNKIIESPCKFKDPVFFVRFDTFNKVFYVEGNRIGFWDINTQKVETLYNMNRAVHGPESLGVSPNGRYVSFCKYRSGGYYLFIYDTLKQICRDLKFTLYHYIWIDETHIAWTLSGGLKVLDVESGKSKTLIKDWSALYKKAKKEDAAMLEKFCSKENTNTHLNLLGFKDGKLYFSLWVDYYYRNNENDLREELKSIHHKGIWVVNEDGTKPAFCYTKPDEFMKAIHKGIMTDGNIYWLDPGVLNIFDGKEVKRIEGPYMPVVYYEMRNK